MTLSALFDPAGIAVVGASTTADKLGHDVMANVAGFEGPVYPVNPSAEGRLFGEPFVRTVTEIDSNTLLAGADVVTALDAMIRLDGNRGSG